MTEPSLFPPTWTCLWCTAGRHWVETAGDSRQWHYRKCPDCKLDYQRRQYADPTKREQIRELANVSQRRRRADPENRKTERAYYKTPTGKAAKARRKARRDARRNPCAHGPDCWRDAFKAMHESSAVCAACGATENIEADHVIPVARGGLDCKDNLQALCKPCNSSKGDKLPEEWQQNRL